MNELTWFPAHGSFFPAAESDFTEESKQVPVAQGASSGGLFGGAGAALTGRRTVAV